MARIHKADTQTLINLQYFLIFTWNEMVKNSLCVIHGVHWFHLRTPGTLRLPVLPFRLKLLDVGGILQHDIAQLTGGSCSVYLAPESAAVQQRQQS